MTLSLRNAIRRTLDGDVSYIKQRLSYAQSDDERRMLVAALATTRESIAKVAR